MDQDDAAEDEAEDADDVEDDDVKGQEDYEVEGDEEDNVEDHEMLTRTFSVCDPAQSTCTSTISPPFSTEVHETER